jgi:hypothetical protein
MLMSLQVFTWIDFAVTDGNTCGATKPWFCAGGGLDHYFKIRMGISDPADRAKSFAMVGYGLSLK